MKEENKPEQTITKQKQKQKQEQTNNQTKTTINQRTVIKSIYK